MSVNVQVYTISNKIMSIQIISTRIGFIGFATAILTVQIKPKLK